MKLRPWHLPVLAVSAVTTLLAGCSTVPDGPEPTDPVVYDASNETRSSVGIAKWGYRTDDAGTTIFRGYDAHNNLVVETRHVFEITGEFTRRFLLKMNGPEVSGAVHVEYESVWRDDTQSAQYVARVIQNTVPRDGIAARILQRVTPDAQAMPATVANALTTSNTASNTATTNAKTLDLPPGSPPLVDENGKPITCCCQLHNNGAVLAGSTLSECGSLGAANGTGTDTSGTLSALDLQGGLRPQDLIVGSNGNPLVDSPWVPPYNIVDNHCHDAAAANVSATNGYVACQSLSSSSSWGGHTVNWAPDPTKKNDKNAFCMYEPQLDGGTVSTPTLVTSGAVCCWEGPAGSNGAPDLTNKDAAACAKQRCGNQYKPPGSKTSDGKADDTTAMPVGQKPQVAKNCSATSNSKDSCNACCKSEGNDILQKFPDSAKDVEDYRKRCETSCDDRYLVKGSTPGLTTNGFTGGALRAADVDFNAPADPSATRCLASGLASNAALAEARALCGIQ